MLFVFLIQPHQRLPSIKVISPKYFIYRRPGIFILVALLFAQMGKSNMASEDDWNNDLTSLKSIVDMRYTPEVQSYLRTYLVDGRAKSERILRRMMLYFPLIEKKLEEYDLPDELKYVAIVESALSPHARSRSGAIGLWQIMAPTAKDLGIRIYHSVDERKDPYRSTEAALDYLARLYDRFGDWELTLAAYNAGPNRIAKIIEKTGKTDYWQLRDDLPRETANYIPAFIAAQYVFSDFNKHGFVPERSHPDFHFTSKVQIFNHKVYLKDVAKLMKIDVDSLKFINPMYKRDYIPESPHGYNLILPNRCLPYFQFLQDTLERSEYVKLAELTSWQNFHSSYSDSIHNIYLNTEYIVQNKENLFTVSRLFNLDIRQLKYWNNLRSLHVDHGMLVDIPLSLVEGKFLIRDYKDVWLTYPVMWSQINQVATMPGQSRGEVLASESIAEAKSKASKEDTRRKFYVITKGIPLKSTLTPNEVKYIIETQGQIHHIGKRLAIGA